jgi:hypothetical protein
MIWENQPLAFVNHVGHFVAQEVCVDICRLMWSPANCFIELVERPRFGAEKDWYSMVADVLEE